MTAADDVTVRRVLDPSWLDGHDAGWEVTADGQVVGLVAERVSVEVPRPPVAYIAACRA